MSNEESRYEQLFKLWTMVCKMIMDGDRDPEKVAEVLQQYLLKNKGEQVLCRNVFERLMRLWFNLWAMIQHAEFFAEVATKLLQGIVDESAWTRKISSGGYLLHIYTTGVGSTDGSETFESSGLFASIVRADGVAPSVGLIPTAEAVCTVHQIEKDAKFAELFRSLGKKRLRWRESHVVCFCRVHPKMLAPDGGATLFELEDGVAIVIVGGSGALSVNIQPMWFEYVWETQFSHRLVTLA